MKGTSLEHKERNGYYHLTEVDRKGDIEEGLN